jgi:hypothetical protein
MIPNRGSGRSGEQEYNNSPYVGATPDHPGRSQITNRLRYSGSWVRVSV